MTTQEQLWLNNIKTRMTIITIKVGLIIANYQNNNTYIKTYHSETFGLDIGNFLHQYKNPVNF